MPGPKVFLGRAEELRQLAECLTDARAGRGRSVLIEGEPGIGKSSLLRAGLAAPEGCRVLWGAADALGQRFPMRALLECLDARERAEVIGAQRGAEEAWLTGPGDPTLAVIERVLALVDRHCAAGPVVLVLDDLQWADEASLLVWNRLARTAGQLPLLLVAACRPTPRRPELTDLRRALLAGDTLLITLEPLAPNEVDELVGELVGADVGPNLAGLAERTGGNPLYIREMVDALMREDRIRVRATAELTEDPVAVPASLTAAITERLGVLSEPTAQILRIAALFGSEFSAMDLAAVTGTPPTDLLNSLDEGITAGVLASTDDRLAFRHPLLRQVLYDGIPRGVRTTLHRQTARTLAAAGAAVARVAEQLLAAAPDAIDEWALDWLAGAVLRLARHAPQVAVTLVEQALEILADDDSRRERLEINLVTILRLLNRFPQAERTAQRLRERTTDPERAAHLAWIVAYCQLGTRRAAEALDLLTGALQEPDTPLRWIARLRALRAVVLVSLGRHDEALATAAVARPEAEAADDRYAIALALHAEAQTVARTDTRRALELIGRALAVAPDGLDGADLRLLMLGNQVTNLTILDRDQEAEHAAHEALRLAEHAGTARYAAIRVIAAQRHFAMGRWDDAQAELEPAAELGTELAFNRPKLIVFHGLAALIAAHRDDALTAMEHLDAVATVVITEGVLRRSSDYLMLARATVAERDGDRPRAIVALAPALNPERAKDVTRRHPVLPDLVRLALLLGDRATADRAAEVCAAQASASGLPGAIAAADRCQGLLDGEPEPLLSAAGYYRTTGRLLELGQTLEDLAELHGRAGRTADARVAFHEAVEVYTTLGAAWDIRRAQTRVRPLGIRRGQRGSRQRPSSGWDALTPTELTVAGMVASGLSNPDIAAQLFLSRRTVQTHVSHILRKLGARTRVDITREVLRH